MTRTPWHQSLTELQQLENERSEKTDALLFLSVFAGGALIGGVVLCAYGLFDWIF